MYVRALNNVSFELARGDRLGVVGHNGSGKSTLLRALGGIYRAKVGAIEMSSAPRIILDPTTGLSPEATGRENIGILARYNGRSSREIAEASAEIADFTGLGDFIDLPLKTYSQGMVARLAFAVGTHWAPEILLMDEWIAVADKNFKAAAMERLTSLVSRANVVVLASHDDEILRRLCTKILVLEHGEVRSFGPTSESVLRAA